ncbi:MAG: hypothetical protein ACREFX_02515, partial [Opitutaceae bacterium]
PERLLFAINPSGQDAVVEPGAAVTGRSWRKWADADRFYSRPLWGGPTFADGKLVVPALGCGLWAPA